MKKVLRWNIVMFLISACVALLVYAFTRDVFISMVAGGMAGFIPTSRAKLFEDQDGFLRMSVAQFMSVCAVALSTAVTDWHLDDWVMLSIFVATSIGMSAWIAHSMWKQHLGDWWPCFLTALTPGIGIMFGLCWSGGRHLPPSYREWKRRRKLDHKARVVFKH